MRSSHSDLCTNKQQTNHLSVRYVEHWQHIISIIAQTAITDYLYGAHSSNILGACKTEDRENPNSIYAVFVGVQSYHITKVPTD